jgi:LPS-assembly lipoprotein
VLPPPANPASAQVILDILAEQREKVVVGLNASGQVREFQLRSRVRFRLRTPQGRELIPETMLEQTRDVSFNEAAVLAKEAEEGLLYRDMQTDLVRQLMRRLAAVKSI